MSSGVPPQNIDAEKSVLGALLVSEPALERIIDDLTLRSEDFYLDSHRLIYEVIVNLYSRGSSVDELTVDDVIKRDGKTEQAGGASYISLLASTVPDPGNVSHYGEIVADHATRRRALGASHEIARLVEEPGLEIEDLIDQVERAPLEVRPTLAAGSGPTSAEQPADDSIDELQKRQEGVVTVSSIPTGLAALDNQLGGAPGPRSLMVVAGRPGTGKSVLVNQVAFHMARDEGKGVMIFSLEMVKRELMDRLLISMAGVDGEKFSKGELSLDDVNLVLDARRDLDNWQDRLWVDDRTRQTLATIRTAARKRARSGDLSLIVVDYLQLLTPVVSRQASRENEVAHLARGLKLLAGELNVPILAASQINRTSDSRPDRRPRLSDLRESGEIEQAADIVALLQGPTEADATVDTGFGSPEPEDDSSVTWCHIDKIRNGRPGSVKVFLEGSHFRFTDITGARL